MCLFQELFCVLSSTRSLGINQFEQMFVNELRILYTAGQKLQLLLLVGRQQFVLSLLQHPLESKHEALVIPIAHSVNLLCFGISQNHQTSMFFAWYHGLTFNCYQDKMATNVILISPSPFFPNQPCVCLISVSSCFKHFYLLFIKLVNIFLWMSETALIDTSSCVCF